jgi:hypothetical protein
MTYFMPFGVVNFWIGIEGLARQSQTQQVSFNHEGRKEHEVKKCTLNDLRILRVLRALRGWKAFRRIEHHELAQAPETFKHRKAKDTKYRLDLREVIDFQRAIPSFVRFESFVVICSS